MGIIPVVRNYDILSKLPCCTVVFFSVKRNSPVEKLNRYKRWDQYMMK